MIIWRRWNWSRYLIRYLLLLLWFWICRIGHTHTHIQIYGLITFTCTLTVFLLFFFFFFNFFILCYQHMKQYVRRRWEATEQYNTKFEFRKFVVECCHLFFFVNHMIFVLELSFTLNKRALSIRNNNNKTKQNKQTQKRRHRIVLTNGQ